MSLVHPIGLPETQEAVAKWCSVKKVFLEISFEINLSKRKQFLNCSYKPNKNVILKYLESLYRIVDTFNKITTINFLIGLYASMASF